MPVTPANANYGQTISSTAILIFASERCGGQQMNGAQAITVYNSGTNDLEVHFNGFMADQYGPNDGATTTQVIPDPGIDDIDTWWQTQQPEVARIPSGTSMTFEVTDINNGSQIDWVVVHAPGSDTTVDWSVTKRK
jgi:hypothetical protein